MSTQRNISSYILLATLSIIPLLRFSIEDPLLTRGTWRELVIIFAAIIVIIILNYKNVHQKNIKVALISLAIIFISAGLSIQHPNLLSIIYLFLGILVTTAIATSINKKNISFLILSVIACACLYAQWSTAQFILQHDLGLSKIGESILTINTAGVASFYIHDTKLIRGYGPFSHANLLGGILALGIILLTVVWKTIKPPISYSLLCILLLGLVTSFSRTAIASVLLLGIVMFIWRKQRIFIIGLIAITILFLPLLIMRSTDSRDVSVHDRVEGLTWARNLTTQKSFIRGLGLGNYQRVLATYLNKNSIAHYAWDIAPVHSVPVFIIMEVGIVISILLAITFLYFIIKYKAWIFLVILPTILFDHYFATQIGALTWLILCAIILSRVY
jgi:hypothetical protein